jgi:hypothetical protein
MQRSRFCSNHRGGLNTKTATILTRTSQCLAATALMAGIALGAAAAATAEPLDANCIAGKMSANGSCYYANCTEAKAAGECDILEGDAHYCPKQDRDNDGIACEC